MKKEEEWRRLITDILRTGHLSGSQVWLSSKPVQDAFRYFGLNPREPSHHVVVLAVLADVVFGRRPRGRRRGSQSWDQLRLFLLGCDYMKVMENEPGMSDTKAAKKIKQLPRYKYVTDTTIRQRLPDARRKFELMVPTPKPPWLEWRL
jgi:hypothetical protein